MEQSSFFSNTPSYVNKSPLDFLTNHPDIGIFTLSPEGCFRKANHKFCKMLGYNENEFALLSVKDVTHPGDWEHEADRFNLSGDQAGESYSLEKRFVKKDGTSLWANVAIWAAPSQDDGSWQYFCIVQDITKHKQKEKELEDTQKIFAYIFDTTYPMIAYLDTEFNFIRVNKPYAAADGHTPEFFTGRNHFVLYPNKENEEIFRHVVESGEPVSYTAKSFEYAHNPELGITYWDWDLIPVKNSEGAVKGLIFSLVNVTEREKDQQSMREANERLEGRVRARTIELEKEVRERKLVEEALLHAKEQAESANAVKSEYLANMSHELRTPLNVILSAIQLSDLYLQGDLSVNKDKFSKHMKSMKQNCYRLLRLVNNLIDTTKIDTNFYEIRLNNHDIIRIIDGIILSVSEYVKQKNIGLNYHTGVQSRILACDADMVERILLNLLSNAVKFTPPGGEIHVNAHVDDGKFIFSVKDNGIGIPQEKQDLIFERYKQVSQLLTRSHEGSGIGLSLTKSLVEMHNGSISVKSECGKGSEFIVELPDQILSCSDRSPAGPGYMINNQRIVERITVEFSDIYK